MHHISARPVLLVMILLFGFCVSSAYSEQAIVSSPDNIKLAGTTSSAINRTIILTAQEDVAGLRFIPSDLVTPEGKVIPSWMIQATIDNRTMPNGSIQSVPVRFGLPGDIFAYGNYSGELWFSGSGNVKTTVPVTLTLKNGWQIPFFLLLGAVILSMWVYSYSIGGKKRDEILKGVANIHLRITHDKELKKSYHGVVNPFCTAMSQGVKNLLDKVNDDAIEDAGKLLEETRKLWGKWTTKCYDWMNEFENYGKLIDLLEDDEKEILQDPNIANIPSPPTTITFVRELIDYLEQEYRKVVDADGPDTFRLIISAQIAKRKSYLVLHDDLLRLSQQSSQADFQNSVKRLYYDFLKLGKDTDLTPLTKEIATLRSQIVTTFGVPVATPMGVGVKDFVPTEPPGVKGIPQLGAEARYRLWLYGSVSFLILLTVLFLVGYNQLYVIKPTFGSPEDYITLVMWGLLVGPFSDAVTKRTAKSLFPEE